MSRSLKKGPFVEPRLLGRIAAVNEAGEKHVIKTWSRSSTIFPDMVGPHHCRARWSQARARIRYRIHGRSQARRICAYAHVQGPRRQEQEISKEADRTWKLRQSPSMCA